MWAVVLSSYMNGPIGEFLVMYALGTRNYNLCINHNNSLKLSLNWGAALIKIGTSSISTLSWLSIPHLSFSCVATKLSISDPVLASKLKLYQKAGF
jgi:hypothetical protein